jgi:hypothetical protein
MTTHRIDITGGWIEYRDPEDVPERLRRKVVNMSGTATKLAGRLMNLDLEDPSSFEGVEITADDMEFLSSFNDAVAMCLVVAWSFDQPVTEEGLVELPKSVYDRIVGYCRDKVPALMPSFGVDPDPKAPTGS